MKRIIIISWIIAICVMKVQAQTISGPNYALKSHETLEIKKVEITSEKTVLYFSIENRISGGNFCADRNIYINVPSGERLKLRLASGIPVCPEIYKFNSIGEKLQFTLEFNPLPISVKWIDVTEECAENCFFFYGVVLNTELNRKLDEAVLLAQKGDVTGATASYISILNGLSATDEGIKASLYTDIITLLVRNGDQTGAAGWYKKMIESNAPRLDLFIANLNSRGIKY